MSVRDNAIATDARAIEATAAEWFGRQQFWNWTEQDQAALDAWLEEALAHKVAYWRLAAAWERTERLNALPRSLARQPPVSSELPRKGLLRFGTVAALFLVAAIGAAYLFGGDGSQTYATGLGESRTISLGDGSRIQLNTNTLLKAEVSDRKRAVILEQGEAFFQIRHDEKHPFVVFVAGNRITDLGTKFSVRKEGDDAQVVLVEGKARLETAPFEGLTRSATLVPGEIALAAPGSLTVKRPSEQTLENSLSWRSGVLVFDNETLGQAAAEFNRYNNTKLVISDPEIARISVAGRFPTDGVDRFADVVRHVFGLHVHTDHDVMVIVR